MKTRYKLFLSPLLLVSNVLLWQYAAVNCPLFQPFWEVLHAEDGPDCRFNALATAGALVSSFAWGICMLTEVKFQDEIKD